MLPVSIMIKVFVKFVDLILNFKRHGHKVCFCKFFLSYACTTWHLF